MNEAERIQRFEAAYNRIDRALSDLIAPGGDRRKHGFSAKVRLAAQRRRRFVRFVDFLLEIGELRNALVHGRTGDDEYLAVPSDRTVLELERIESAAFSPEKVAPRFVRPVVTLRSDQTLAEAWKLLRADGFSRYPVMGRQGFIGLLTSNGLARWCADQLRGDRIDVDTSTVTVADVLGLDHRRNAVKFVASNALIDDVEQMFREIDPLEAVVITQDGRLDQPPLGLVCAQDLAALPR